MLVHKYSADHSVPWISTGQELMSQLPSDGERVWSLHAIKIRTELGVAIHVWTRVFPIDTQFPNMESIPHEFVFRWHLGVHGSCTLLRHLWWLICS